MHISGIRNWNLNGVFRPKSNQKRIQLTTTIAEDIPKDVKKSIKPLVSALADYGNTKWFNFNIEKGKGLKNVIVITSYPADYEAGRVVKKEPFMSTLLDLNKVDSKEYLGEVTKDIFNTLSNIGK